MHFSLVNDMDIRRFFIDKSAFDGNTFRISGDEYLHMTKVLRYKVGYKVILCLNDGYDYYSTITEIAKDYLIARLDDKINNDTRTISDITLIQAVPKGDKFDFIAQKSVELGVETIQPFISRYCNEKSINYDRCMRIMLEACKQCGRSRISELKDVISFADVVSSLNNYDAVFMAYENEREKNLNDYSDVVENAHKIAVIVGSEGGFADEEYQILKEKGVKTFSLGKRILRAETASVVAVSLIMFLKGEMNI